MATIQGVYVALFGRPADPTGLTYFNGVTQNGANLNGIGDLASTQEYKDRFAGQNNNTIVNSIYQSLFGRDAEAAGLNFFVDALNKGTLNIKNIAIAILDGAQGTDKTIVTNKVAAADLYTKALDTASEIAGYSGNTAAAQGRAFITGVTTTVPTTAQVDASVKTMVDAGSAGNTIVLTAGSDTLSLTAGLGTPVVFATDRNDTINATAATNDWDATDVINGGFGTDTLNAKIDAAVTVAADGLKSVEILSLNVVTNVAAVDVANAKELTQVWDNASTKALTVNNVALTTSVGVKGAITELTTFAFAGATGTADTATLVADGATGTVGVTIAAIETLNINNTGTTNLGALTVADAKAIAISGSGSLTFTSASTAIETVNASAFSGKVTLDFTAQNALKSYVGGTGSDVITIDGQHTNDITISGGDGADTITVTATGTETKALTISGGAGSDIFVLNASGNVQAIDTAANFVKTLITISDFDKAADAIKFINGVGRDTILVAEQAAIDGAADILAAAQLAAGYTDVTKASIFTYKGDAYLFQNDATLALTAGDTIVKVTGVTSAADFTASNFSLTV